MNIIDFDTSLHDAVNQPRIHFENGLLSIEPGFDADALGPLCKQFNNYELWQQQNLFFGGVHTVSGDNGKFDGAGDQRRDGVASVIG